MPISPEDPVFGNVDPSTLYNEDGSVNLEAANEVLQNSRIYFENAVANPLDEISISSPSLTYTIDKSNDDNSETEDMAEFKSREPLLYALLYASFYNHIEFEHPIGPINDELYKNPSLQLDLPIELNRYFEFYSEHQKQATTMFQNAHNRLGKSPNNVEQLRAIIAIPVAGHQEHANIYKTLEQFAKQDIDPINFEIVLHINMPLEDDLVDSRPKEDALAASLQLMLNEIDRFKIDHPEIVVRYFAQTYKIMPPPIGKVRSDLWAVIGNDLQQRGRTEDILVISSDADVIHLNKQYVRSMVETFEQTGADVVTANLKWQNAPGLPYDATLNRVMRYQTFLDIIRDNHSKFLHTADANTGISLAAYFAVGGYDRQAILGEMNSLVNRIRLFRSKKDTDDKYEPVKQVEAKANRAWLRTHSRRLITAMALGHSPYSAWNQALIEFGANDELRTGDINVEQAEIMAKERWPQWLKSMTPYYTKDLDTITKRRILKAGRQCR